MWELDYDGALLLRMPETRQTVFKAAAFTNSHCGAMCVKFSLTLCDLNQH